MNIATNRQTFILSRLARLQRLEVGRFDRLMSQPSIENEAKYFDAARRFAEAKQGIATSE